MVTNASEFIRIPANFLRSLRSVCRIYCESFANVKNTYECLTITTNALPSIRIYCDAYEYNKNIIYAFLANFRNMFLIFATPHERPRMLTNTYECLAIICDHYELMGKIILSKKNPTYSVLSLALNRAL